MKDNPNSENPRPIVNVDSGLKALDDPRLVRAPDSGDDPLTEMELALGSLAYLKQVDEKSANGTKKFLEQGRITSLRAIASVVLRLHQFCQQESSPNS